MSDFYNKYINNKTLVRKVTKSDGSFDYNTNTYEILKYESYPQDDLEFIILDNDKKLQVIDVEGEDSFLVIDADTNEQYQCELNLKMGVGVINPRGING